VASNPSLVAGDEEVTPEDQDARLAKAGLGNHTAHSGSTFDANRGGAGTSRDAGRFQVMPPAGTLHHADYVQQGEVDHQYWGANFRANYDQHQQINPDIRVLIPEWWVWAAGSQLTGLDDRLAQMCEGYGGNPSGSSMLDALCDVNDPPPPRDHARWTPWRRVMLTRYAQYEATVDPLHLRDEFILAHNVRMRAQGTDRGATAGGPVHLDDTGRYRFDVATTVRPGWFPKPPVQPGFESGFGTAQEDEGDTDPALGAGAEPQQGAQAPPPTNFRPPPRMPSAFDAVNPEVRSVPTLPPRE
jgi:hypothetical protein